MSSFGTGTTTTGGSSIVLTAFTGTNGAQAGTDGLVPGPAVNQAGYILGAGGDWTLSILGGIPLNESSDRIATTEFVQDVVGNAVLGGNAQLSQLTDVTIAGLADDQFLQYNAGAGKWENATLTLSLISDVNLAGLVDGNALVYDANAGQWVPGQGGGGGAANLNDLGDVSVANPALNEFLVFDGNNFANQTISTSELSDSADVVLTSSGATFGAFAYDFTLSTVSVQAPTLDAHASTKKYVDDEVATAQPLDATLTGLSALAPVDNDLIIATGNDTFGVINISADLESFLSTDAEIGNLSNVTLGGVGLANSQVLKYENGAWINEALDFSELSGTGDVALLSANQTFTGTVLATTQALNDNSTKLATTAYVESQIDNDINALNLGTASQSNVGDFLASGASIADLSDVNSIANIQDGNVLAWVAGNNRFEFTAPAQTYTDEMARDAVGIALQGGAHTGISFSNNDNADTIDATVSLGGFSVGDLSDVNLGGVVNGKILKYNNGSFEVADETDTNTQLSAEQVQDIVGPMFTANNAGNTGVTFSYDDTGGVNDGTVTATVSIASTDLTDTANVARLNAVQTFSANNTFTADVDLTGANATATTQNASDNSTKLATTAYVDAQIDTDITALDLANTYQAKDASLDDITGIADGDLLLGNGVDSFEKVSVTAGVESFLKSAGASGDLSDTTIGVKAEGQVLRIGADNSTFENSVLSFGDLSNTGNVVQTSSGATFGAFAYDFTLSTVSVKAPTLDAHASTKKYVDDAIDADINALDLANTYQAKDASLDTITGIADSDLLLGNGADSFEKVSIQLGVENFLRSTARIAALSDVSLNGDELVNANHFLVSTGNGGFANQTISTSNLSNSADVVLTSAGFTFGNFDYDFTGVNSITVKTPTANAHAATKQYVDNKFAAGGGISSLNDLDDVTIGAKSDAQILVLTYSNDGDDTNDIFNNVSLSGHISITNAGVATLADNAVATAKIADGNVTEAKLDTDSVTTVKIVDGNVTNAKLLNSSVTVGSTSISLGDTSTILSGLTGVDFTNADATIGATMTTNNGNPTVLTLGGAGSKVLVSGDLQVQGDTTTINTSTLDVEDTIIRLNKGVDGGANTNDIGLFFERGTTGNDAVFFFDESTDTFKLGTTTDAHTDTEFDDNNLTLSPLRVDSPALGDDSTLVATTAYVQAEITDLDLANTYQPLDATLTALAGVNTVADRLIYASGVDTFSVTTLSAFARTLLDDADANTARTTLGLTSTATTDIGDLLQSANNLNDLDNVATARTNLGLEIGSDVQAYDATLQALAGVNTGADRLIYASGVDTFSITIFTAFARSLLDDADANTARTTLGVGIGSDVQAYDATLQSISALGTGANKLIYTTGVDTWAEATLSAFGRSLIDDADSATARATLGVEIGSDVQAYDATLQAVSALGTGADKLIYTTGVDTWAEATLSAFARTLLDDADANTARATLGLTSTATTDLSDLLQVDNSLSEISDAGNEAVARGNLGLGSVSTLDTTINGGNGENGKAVVTDGNGNLGALDGSSLTALGSIGVHSNVDLTDLADGQGLVYNANNTRFEPGTVPTTGIDVGESPTITSQSISLNPNALVGGDLVIYGRVMEVIDYGSVANAFGAGDFAIDFGAVTDTKLYCTEDYGVLVV